MSLQRKFEQFKKITREEEKIIKLIKESLVIKNTTKILEVGSNKGNISKALQKERENITCIDIDELKFEPGINFIKSRWEDVIISEKFDIIIASHVWGHFYYSNTTKQALEKMVNSKKEEGKIVLCFNTNNGFLKKLIHLGKIKFNDFQFDYFDEQRIKYLKKKEINFSVDLETNNFKELADLIQVLIITKDEEFKLKKEEMEDFLRKNLEKPKFKIHQKLVILE